MKKLLSGLLSVVMMYAMVSPAFAKGIFIRPTAKASAMGAAVVSTVNDSSAVYWNPAGLAKMQKKAVEVSATYVAADAKASVAPGINDFPIGAIYPTEPAFYESKVLKTTAFLPFVAGAVPMENGMAIGLGLYGVAGGGGKWEDSIPAGVATIDASLDSLQTFSVYNVSFAKDFGSGLCAGAGLNMVNMTDSLKLKKDFTSLTVATNYGIEIEKKASGYGLEAVGGLMYAVQPNINLGLVVRSGTEIKLSGTAKATPSGSVTVMPSNEVDYDQKYFYPMTTALGVSYDPSEKVTLACAVEQSNYSSLKDNVTYETQAPANGFVNTDAELGWKDTTEIFVGAQYRMDEEWSFMAGYQNSPDVYKNSNASLFDTNKYDLSFLCLGAGYTLEQWSFGLSYMYPFQCKSDINGITFEYPVDLYRLDIGYSF